MGQALVLPLGASLGRGRCRPRSRAVPRSRPTAAQRAQPARATDAPMQSHNPHPALPPKHRTIVEQVTDRRVEHRAGRSQHRHDPQPAVARQRSHSCESDQREDDHEPAVMRPVETVERHRPSVAPGSEHPDDGQERCWRGRSERGAGHDRQGRQGRQRRLTRGNPIAASSRPGKALVSSAGCSWQRADQGDARPAPMARG